MSKIKKVSGDKFILCTFELIGGANVLESGNNLEELCSKIPFHLSQEQDTLSVCKVGYWFTRSHDVTDSEPGDVTTIFQGEPYEVELIDEEEDETVETVSG